MGTTKPTVCLNMIVKNERHVIMRCLDSVKDIIDYWVISDTGSTDGTQEIIANYFGEYQIPGELRQDVWENFSHNRNVALEHAKGKADYILFMDADDYLEKDTDFEFGQLDADSYLLKMHFGDQVYANTKLIKAALPWRWEGVLHEYLQCDAPINGEVLQGDYCIREFREGARSRNPRKYLDDAAVLEKALLHEPHNTRYRFYLAQSYRDAGQYETSLIHYQIRSEMGGWDEEVFYSLLEVARNKQRLGYPDMEVFNAYLKAHHYRPQRLEAIYEVVKASREKAYYHLGYQLGWEARDVPMSEDILFLDGPVYVWKFRDELSICAVYAGYPEHAAAMMEALLSSGVLPEEQLPRVKSNLEFANSLISSGGA